MFNWLFESLSIGFFESLMDANFNIHLGKKLRMRRLSLGLTQTKVANAINVTFQQIQKYEKGTNGVSSSRLMQLSNFLKVPITYFYDDYGELQTDSPNSMGDLNYSFLIKTFGKLSESEKLKIIKILRNTGNLKEVV
jgi:transcriptional regulator with XRE-family HTH domain